MLVPKQQAYECGKTNHNGLKILSILPQKVELTRLKISSIVAEKYLVYLLKNTKQLAHKLKTISDMEFAVMCRHKGTLYAKNDEACEKRWRE